MRWGAYARLHLQWIVLAASAAGACGGDDAGGQQAGFETGPCVEGKCLSGLECLSDVCVDAGGSGTSNAMTPMDGVDPDGGADSTTAPIDPTASPASTTELPDSTASSSDTSATSGTDTGCTGECRTREDCLPGQDCEDCTCTGAPSCPNVQETPCPGGCAWLSESLDNCGACGDACPGAARACSNSCCRFDVGVTEPVSCAEVCAEYGLTCDGNCFRLAVYEGGTCMGYDEILLDSCAQQPPATATCGGICQCPITRVLCGCS